ncbi:arylsulfatase [Solirubrobacter phytolaccae]|uniref:Arylsulfatase n=1 Tax=Solirubrobacter phytolaccae TaxID=1404360 RepID=A0A9X3SA95_9ACTN|nr:arylsulfatase [Solirubrobacter phytolaccae]MDA0183423.1 arylsulfatase [Solirubrobacter phytolaccae]
MARPFKGVINLDVRDSVMDWDAFRDEPAPAGAPNVLVVLYDDTGLAAWSAYGGRINMPTLDRLAANGLTYSQWHTTALCSPTRSCFLTGRNHHQNGFAQIAEGAQGFPGHTGMIPMENATMAEVLRENGWNTFWVGKNHNVPLEDWAMGGSKKHWPLARGFDRFYGFLGGETNQWYPTLAEDNHYVEQPATPEEGYHLSKDLADKALGFIRDSKQSHPDKPWYMWFCPGANHAPHHAPQEYIDKYKGQFDDGYEAYRDWVLPRMVERGILPEGTELTPINPLPEGQMIATDQVRPWDTLSADEQRLFSRMAEVYAGFSEYTDAQVGRIVDYLEASGQLENTLIVYAADNGASGEGSPDGSVNENKVFNAYPDDIAQNLTQLDELGSPSTYNHYPTGWAVAFSTPFKMFKRYTYQGGVSDPLVISWPAGIKARGEVRDQYHHCTDIVPTILECCGVEFPDVVQGYEQSALPGVSMRYSFDDAAAATMKRIQYYEMFGTRALWHEGWKVVAERGPNLGAGRFDDETWQLFNTDVDRAEARDLAAEHPEKVKQLVDLWFVEAGKYDVLPLDDRTLAELVAVMPEAMIPPGGVWRYYPGTTEVPEFVAANTRGRSYKILAEVEIGGNGGAEGVIFAQGARFGGHSLFIKDHKLWYAYNFIGIPPEQQLVSGQELAAGRHVVGVEFEKASHGDHHETLGVAKLYIDEEVVAESEWKTQPGHFALCGEGLTIGRDSSDPVSQEYPAGFAFSGGRILEVEVNVGDDVYLDVERELAAALARD